MKRVLSVGQCPQDQTAIACALEHHFDVEFSTAQGWDDTSKELCDGGVDLVLINRKLDADYSDGVEILRRIKAEPQFATVPVMLVTNYPEHQRQAVELGAEPGFGKAELGRPETLERLRRFLG